MSKIFQNTLSAAVSLHRAMNKSELGKDTFAEWTALVQSVSAPAYAVYAATHDAAGMPSAIVDAESMNAARSALAKSLRPVVAYVGNVSFAGMEGEALLEVNAQLIDLVAGISWKWGWNLSDEVNAITEEISDLSSDLSIAKCWADYYAHGDNEKAKAKYAEQIAVLEGKIAALKVRKSEAAKKENGKVQIAVPQDENGFRKVFENVLNACITRRHAENYAEYMEKLAAKKAKRNAKTAERRKAKKEMEKLAAAK